MYECIEDINCHVIFSCGFDGIKAKNPKVIDIMAVASGPAGPVLAGPVFTVIFGTAHPQIMKFSHLRSCTEQLHVLVPRHGYSKWQYH